MLPINFYNQELSLALAEQLPKIKISQDWFLAPTPEVSFALAMSKRRLLFQAKINKPAHYDTNKTAGSFAAELWQFDCAELFLAAEAKVPYQEINLSPSGAWWSASFASYRKLAAEEPKLSPKIITHQAENSWEVSALFDLNNLAIKPSYGNVSFVLRTNRETEQVQYLSFVKFSKAEPDFHLSTEFAALDYSQCDIAK